MIERALTLNIQTKNIAWDKYIQFLTGLFLHAASISRIGELIGDNSHKDYL